MRFPKKTDPAVIEEATRLLNYDQATGHLTWKVPRHRIPTGARAECQNAYGYWVVTLPSGQYYSHRIAVILMLGRWPYEEVDHRKDNSNNAWGNLWECTRLQNQKNKKLDRRSTSGHTGVNQVENGRWQARIGVDGKRIVLGCFATREEAVSARANAERAHYGEFARNAR